MKKTYDINIDSFNPLIAPDVLKEEFPISPLAGETVLKSREDIQRILRKEDKRLLVVAGPVPSMMKPPHWIMRSA
jgi:3-deoxy-7-phosphoheptulonate synthase